MYHPTMTDTPHGYNPAENMTDAEVCRKYADLFERVHLIGTGRPAGTVYTAALYLFEREVVDRGKDPVAVLQANGIFPRRLPGSGRRGGVRMTRPTVVRCDCGAFVPTATDADPVACPACSGAVSPPRA